MLFCDINIPASHGYICRKHVFEDGYKSTLHWHGFVELEFFIDGTGTHKYNNSTFQIKSGDVWVLSTDDSHQLDLHKGMKSVNIAVNPDILHDKLKKHLSIFHPLHCNFNKEEALAFSEKVDILWNEQEQQNILSRVKANAIINDMLVDVVRKAALDNTLSNNHFANNGVANNMLKYLQANFKNDISLPELASEFSFTPNYCGQILKKATGISFNDYLNNLRVKYACELLLSTDLSIQNIAFDSGFHSVEYFYATFKKFYGITPAKYRTLTSQEIITPFTLKNRSLDELTKP